MNDWRPLIAALQHVAAIELSESAGKAALHAALVSGDVRTRGRRLSGWYPYKPVGFDPQKGLSKETWTEWAAHHRVLWNENSVWFVLSGTVAGKPRTVRVSVSGVEVYWPDLLKLWPESNQHEPSATQRRDGESATKKRQTKKLHATPQQDYVRTLIPKVYLEGVPAYTSVGQVKKDLEAYRDRYNKEHPKNPLPPIPGWDAIRAALGREPSSN